VRVCEVYLRPYSRRDTFSMPSRLDPPGVLSKLAQKLVQCAGEYAKEPEGRDRFDRLIVSAEGTAKFLTRHQGLAAQAEENKDIMLIVSQLGGGVGRQSPCIQQAALLVINSFILTDPDSALAQMLARQLHRLINVPKEDPQGFPSLELIFSLMARLVAARESFSRDYLRSGLVLTLLSVLARGPPVFTRSQCKGAARVLGLLARSGIGAEYLDVLTLLLAPVFRGPLKAAADSPSALVSFFHKVHQTPLIHWTDDCRYELLDFLDVEMRGLKRYQAETQQAMLQFRATGYNWRRERIAERFQRNALLDELCVGGIYVHYLNRAPYFKHRKFDVTRTFPLLLDALKVEFKSYSHSWDFRRERQSVPSRHQRSVSPPLLLHPSQNTHPALPLPTTPGRFRRLPVSLRVHDPSFPSLPFSLLLAPSYFPSRTSSPPFFLQERCRPVRVPGHPARPPLGAPPALARRRRPGNPLGLVPPARPAAHSDPEPARPGAALRAGRRS